MDIKKGRLYLADLNPRFGTEPGKLRPVVAVQTNLLNEALHPSTLICPTTTNTIKRAKWLRIHLAQGEAGLERPSDVLVDQIRSIDNRRFKKELGALNKNSCVAIKQSLQVMMDL
jgi:mRNA interferase MazF